MRLCLAILMAAAITVTACASAAATRRFAVVVGCNGGREAGAKLRFAERDAAKMHAVLVELGGVAPGDAALLLGTDAKAVQAALEDVDRRIGAAKARGDQTVLVFYFSGHASGDELELGGSVIEFAALKKLLATSKADVRLAFLDSCQAGGLIASKGGRRGPAYNIRVADEIASTGYAIITSSTEDELSQESAELRGAFFTHYLVSALRGAGDESGDGKVTLGEAYRYAYRRTLARTAATVGGGQHPMYNFQLSGRGDIVLTETAGASAQIAVNVPDSGRLLILDGRREAIVAEVELAADRDARVNVRPGDYSVYVVTPKGAVRHAEATVAAGGRAALGPAAFETTALEVSVAKGGLFGDADAPWRHSIGAGGLWRLFPLAGGAASYGATLHYRIEGPRGWQPALRLTWATRDDVGLSTGYNDIGVAAGFGRVVPLAWTRLRAEVLAGYEHLFQAPREGRERHTSGFAYLLLVGLELPAGGACFGVEIGSGGRVFQVTDKGWVHRVDFQAALYAAWRWVETP
jgi:hypothetical protein